MNHVDTEFVEILKHKPLVCFRYTNDVFYFWTHRKEKLSSFLEDFNKFHPNIKFFHEFRKGSIHSLKLNVRLSDGKISIVS